MESGQVAAPCLRCGAPKKRTPRSKKAYSSLAAGAARGARPRERAVPDAHAPARRQTQAKLRDAHGTLGRAGAGTSRHACC